MHLDTDVLPGQLIAAPLLAQYPESHSPGCEPQIIEGALTQEGLELPAEWQVVALGVHPNRSGEINCGILGGTNTAFIKRYARVAVDLVRNPLHCAA